MKEFITAVRDRDGEEDSPVPDIEFKVDGQTLIAHGPTSGELTLFLAATGDMVSTPKMVATSINFLFGLLDNDDNRFLQRKLFDRSDPFDARDVADILSFLIEEWSGDPTDAPSDSPPSRSSTGAKSTARRRSGVSTR